MRTFSIVIILMLLALTDQAQITSARLQASGLTCAMCARSVYKNLESLPFIDSIDTDLEQSAFVLLFKGGATVDADQIRKKVEDAGFSVAALQLTASFNRQDLKPDGHLTLSGRTYHILPSAGGLPDGAAPLLLVDKSFLPAKELKKYASLSASSCFLTGQSGGKCCEDAGIPARQRIYHLSL